jgi:hypothetical protein
MLQCSLFLRHFELRQNKDVLAHSCQRTFHRIIVDTIEYAYAIVDTDSRTSGHDIPKLVIVTSHLMNCTVVSPSRRALRDLFDSDNIHRRTSELNHA